MTVFYDQEATVPRLPDPVLRAEHGGGGAAAAHRHPAHVPLRAPRPQLAPGYNNNTLVPHIDLSVKLYNHGEGPY